MVKIKNVKTDFLTKTLLLCNYSLQNKLQKKEINMLASKKEGLIYERVYDEIVVYNEDRQEASSLNSTAAEVFEICDKASSITDLRESIKKNYNKTLNDDVILLTLYDLKKADLIELNDKPSELLGRREVLSKIRNSAVALALLPTITTITAPETKAQSSTTTMMMTTTPTTTPPFMTTPPPPTPPIID